MDNVELGDESIVGALSFVQSDQTIPERSLLVGNPAKIIKSVRDEMIKWKTAGTRLYQQLPAEMHASFKACEPLTAPEKDRLTQEQLYHTWNSIKPGGNESPG